jgi:hypothetical protein
VAAAMALLDRAYGKPTLPLVGDDTMAAIAITGDGAGTLSQAERDRLVAALVEHRRAAP